MRSRPVTRAGVAGALLLGLSVATVAPALAVETPSPRYYTADDVSDEYGGPGLTWSGTAEYGTGRSGDRDDGAFALTGTNILRADDPSEGNFGTRPFTLRFAARFTGSGGAEEQVLSKRVACRDGSFLDVRTRDGQVYAELQGAGNRARVLHPADVHDGDWHVVTVGRNGTALSVTVDGAMATRHSAGVADLDNSAPMRFGDGPCVGDETTRAEVLLDDISYGTGVLPTERPLVPGLPLSQPPLESVLSGPGGILEPAAGEDEESRESAAERTPESRADSEVPAAPSPTAASRPGGGGGRGSALAAGAAPAPSAPRGSTAAIDFPADSGAAAGIAAAVLPGAGDAAAHSAYTGLDWTGVLPPPAPGAPAPALPWAPSAPPAGGPTSAGDPAPPGAPAPAGSEEQAADPGVAAVSFAQGLRSPAEVRWNLGAIAQSLLITLVLLALLALPVGVVNATARANAGRIGTAIDAATARLRAPALTAWLGRLPLAGAVTATAAVGAVLYAFPEPTFGFDRSSLALVLGLALAFLVVTAAQQAARSAYMDRWWGIPGQLGLFPGFLLLGLGCVIVSRLFGLEPGLILGTLLAFGTSKALRSDEEGPAVAVSAVSLLVLGLLAWVTRDVVVGAAGSEGAFLPDMLNAALTAVAVAAICNLAFAMVPLGFLDGGALFRWSKPVWTVLAGTGAFAFVHVLLGAPAGAGALAGRGTFLAVLVGAYLLISAAFWAWFRYRPQPAAATAERERTVCR